FGCQMNVNDSEILAGILEDNGYALAEVPQKADIILVNTCSIRQKAEDRAYTFLRELKKLKKTNPDLIIGICGCVPQREKENIVKQLPFVDLVMGPQCVDDFSNILQEIEPNKETQFYIEEKGRPRKIHPTKRAKSPRAYINIMYGCNNYCSYCIVPYVRGREVFRPSKDIMEEIKKLDKSIHKEVILLGQNVNSWSEGDKTFSDLLREVHKAPGVEWISFMTSHPKDMTDEIIETVAKLPKLNNHIHLPVQSGSTKIMKAMNRKYDRDYYLKLIEKIYKKIPEATVTSDIIVGFPGETGKDFKDSLSMIRQANFDSVITAAYSIRPGTKAAAMKGQIETSVKKERLQKIMQVVQDVAYQKNQKLVGKTMDLLVEGPAQKGKLSGRTRGSKIVYFDGSKNLICQIIPMKITSAKSWVLEGQRT
ncbi:MAG: tRNA (N6-isopentenyl adenosine(37)-C2)-methylthiotransferase MiaB, partial [Candidatus Margulisbacteria bacterium]|nr:tRNA (N6-isopentenyl adenosine(37)-C2)-methylthiotransferase MiaB [Candidatus Margulisiibacteriota bacterium]